MTDVAYEADAEPSGSLDRLPLGRSQLPRQLLAFGTLPGPEERAEPVPLGSAMRGVASIGMVLVWIATRGTRQRHRKRVFTELMAQAERGRRRGLGGVGGFHDARAHQHAAGPQKAPLWQSQQRRPAHPSRQRLRQAGASPTGQHHRQTFKHHLQTGTSPPVAEGESIDLLGEGLAWRQARSRQRNRRTCNSICTGRPPTALSASRRTYRL